MAIRTIIKIDEEKCNGCGICVDACHEGALAMVDGKAKLMRDDYCDGLGACLPSCPTGAIGFEEREALAFDEEAVAAKMAAAAAPSPAPRFTPAGCPGMAANQFKRSTPVSVPAPAANREPESQLQQWPVQIKLVAPTAAFFDNASLLIAADCSAFAYAGFHDKFMQGKITLIGCPKLDEGDYSEKLTAILRMNNIRSVTCVRMQVPCCGGLESAVKRALAASGKMIPWSVAVVATNGDLIEHI